MPTLSSYACFPRSNEVTYSPAAIPEVVSAADASQPIAMMGQPQAVADDHLIPDDAAAMSTTATTSLAATLTTSPLQLKLRAANSPAGQECAADSSNYYDKNDNNNTKLKNHPIHDADANYDHHQWKEEVTHLQDAEDRPG